MGQPVHGPAIHHPRPHLMILKRPWMATWSFLTNYARVLLL
jgi:hypothetical protein